MSKSNKNLARTLRVNTAELTRQVGPELPTNRTVLWELVCRMRNVIWGENLAQADHQTRLFDWTPWRKLKMATMDRRGLPMPGWLIPANEKQLQRHCERLLSRDDDPQLRQCFIEGWGNDSTSLDRFCRKLWLTRVDDPDFYKLTVTGNHLSALDYLRNRRNSRTLLLDRAVRLLVIMALIYAAHDSQAAAGRAHRASTRPLGWLLQGAGERMTAGTIFAVFRPVYKVTGKLFGLARTVAERVQGKREGKLPRNAVVVDLKQQSVPIQQRPNLAKVVRADRDQLLIDVRHDHAYKSDDFWDEVRLDKASGKYTHKRMTQVWYSDLTPVEVLAIPVLRLIQAEACLTQRIEASLRSSSLGVPLRLPPLESAKLPKGWKTRARLLVDHLRRVVLDDKDHHSVRKAKRRAGRDSASQEPAHDDTWLGRAAQFVELASKQQAIGNRHLSEVKTFDLLDVAVNSRFSGGKRGAGVPPTV